jgi:sigma-B regulation protein RsbU (phosphoserine phosphatase)
VSSPSEVPNTGKFRRLACAELRGGNDLAEYEAELPGLSGWVSCRPLPPALRGGDLYYLSACSHGVIARVALADVSGHGEVVSSAAIDLHDSLLQYIDHWDQSQLIRQLSDSFLSHAFYATAFVASYYSDAAELLFTNAGHLPPLWYRSATREWSFLRDSTPLSTQVVDLPLGLIPGTSYCQTAVKIAPGDLLLLYTDGINESWDEAGAQLGLAGLLRIARNLPVDSAAGAGKALLEAVARFRGTASVTDDETVVALHRPADAI